MNPAQLFKRLALITPLALALATPVLADELRTQTIWTTSGTGGVDVIPYVRVDKKAVFVDFEADSFDNIDYVYYNMVYETDEPESKRGVEGTFFPAVTKIFSYYNGRPYYRTGEMGVKGEAGGGLVLGTCSRQVCTYYKNPKSLKLTVTTKYKTGKVLDHTKVITIADDQFK